MGKRGRATVVVLGDIGRSPRMQYHALSLASQASLKVDIVAYGGSDPHPAVLKHPSICIHKMAQWPKFTQNLPWLLRYFVLLLKPIFQFLVLLWHLCVRIPAPDVFLVQNPPSVPTLVAVKWASWIRHSAFIVDWHNFGYTLLGLSLGRGSRFVAAYRWFEKHYGQLADGSLCVTKAMQHELAQNWGIRATVLYDQPPDFFHPASIEDKHKLFLKLDKEFRHFEGVRDCISHGSRHMTDESHDSLFTTIFKTGVIEKSTRPALVVSSTSWTPDEDFDILLEAAVMYDRRVAAILSEDDSIKNEAIWDAMNDGKQIMYPRLLFVITGKGPEKEKYIQKMKNLNLKRVAFRTMWLAAEDYPLLLGSADLGVCLHTSSSGLDLPMKVVDMFGCGLPVCAASYSCIEELVKVEINGLLFSSSSELADQLLMLFKGFPNECDVLSSLRNGALETRSSAAWATEWEEHAKPLVLEAVLEETHTRTIRSCAWSPSGKRLATASFDATAAIWENIGGDYECISTLEGHENEVKSVSWNADGSLIATCGRDKSVWIWIAEPGNEFECVEVLQGHTQDVKMVQWHPSMDLLFSCSYDNSIKIWAEDGDDDWHCVQTLNEASNGHTSTVWALSFNASGDKMVTCSDDLTIKIWGTDSLHSESGDDFAPWRHLCTISGCHDRTIFSVHWSRNGVIATGAADDAIRLFVENDDGLVDGPMYKLLSKKEKAHEMDVNSIQWSPKEKPLLASASDEGTIKIWEYASTS